ncbi:MAG: DUF4392 domain-containing protein [Burkholderiales bacterium]|nr:DUF4392 domain-containing protein [Burkholderiales bacterium]
MFSLIDRIVSLDLGQRGMANLYEPARKRCTEPLCAASARHLISLKRGDVVVFLTGSIVRGWVSPALAETDGPIGVASLARAVNYGFNAIPVVLTDPSLVPAVAATMETAGLTVVDEAHARAASDNERFTSVAVVSTCSTDPRKARDDARALLERLRPTAVISAERAGMTADGTFRNSVGQNTSAGRALLDHVVAEAMSRRIPTIGIGDLGNEIGMAAIRSAVVENVPNGDIICSAQETDILYPCGVSNWGCYAIQAAMAILTGRIELAHTSQMERRLLEASPRIGLVDGLHGKREPTADGLPLSVHLAVADLLFATAERGIAFQKIVGDKDPVYDAAKLAHFRKRML